MNTAWFKYLPIDEQDHRKSVVKKNQEAWEILTDVLQKHLEHTEYHPSYDNAAWPYAQAHTNGKREMLEYIIKLLKE